MQRFTTGLPNLFTGMGQRWKPVMSTDTGRVAVRVEILRPAGQAGWNTGRILLPGN